MKHAFLFIVALSSIGSAFAQANTKLSNLIAPTAVNVDLFPNANNTRNLGSRTFGWKSIYTTGRYYINGGLFLHNKGINNTFFGDSSGTAVTTGNSNTGIGDRSLFKTITGSFNTALGRNTLYNNTSGIDNTATGYQTLFSNTEGSYNTAGGFNTLYYNTTGHDNTAFGVDALLRNTTGSYNIAVGNYALRSNVTGSQNTAVGELALNRYTGPANTAIGYKALELCVINTSASSLNTAVGAYALSRNTTGYHNTAMGFNALLQTSIGYQNTGFGEGALFYNVTGAFNTAIGMACGPAYGKTNLSNTIAVGHTTWTTASNQVRIGNSSMTSIGGYAGWSNISDGRIKKNIKTDIPGLSFVRMLTPVSYTLDLNEADKIMGQNEQIHTDGVSWLKTPDEIAARKKKEKVVYSGFIAQEVEKAARQLKFEFSGVDAAKNENDLYSLRYAEFVVPLVKAVQELDSTNKVKDIRITKLEEINTNQQNQLDELRKMVLELKNGGLGTTITSNLGYLEQNTPNPSNSSTAIRYYVSQSAVSARLTFTNAKGQLIKTMTISNRGTGQVSLESGMLAAGAYNYTLWVDGKQADTKKLVITR